MMKVGLEFIIQKEKWKRYIIDYFAASLAAGVPWILCFFYFLIFGECSWREDLLLARFAAPTATGVLFTLLGLAGLTMTWMFKKIQVLVILDDLDTILFLIPIQFILSHGQTRLIFVAIGMIILLILGWRYMHRLKWPSSQPWLLCYAIAIAVIIQVLKIGLSMELEILLPSFILGVVLYHSHSAAPVPHQEQVTPKRKKDIGPIVDKGIKLLFLFFVGLLLPKITTDKQALSTLILHVLFVTILMNLGKLVLIFFYSKEASLRERVALSIGMMPRGEVGAGVLTLALAYGIHDAMAQVATLSLALNLFLTGFFIWITLRLLKPVLKAEKQS